MLVYHEAFKRIRMKDLFNHFLDSTGIVQLRHTLSSVIPKAKLSIDSMKALYKSAIGTFDF